VFVPRSRPAATASAPGAGPGPGLPGAVSVAGALARVGTGGIGRSSAADGRDWLGQARNIYPNGGDESKRDTDSFLFPFAANPITVD
jgi:hypothetical protein